MTKYCGVLNIGSVQGGGTVGAQTIQGDRVTQSFVVPVAIAYEMSIGDAHFKKIRCNEQAMAPFVAQNNGNDVCIYTFKQIPRTTVMMGIISKDGPSYRMSKGRMFGNIFAQQIFVPLIICIPLLLLGPIGWAALLVILFFTTKYGIGIYKTWYAMPKT